MIKLYLHFGYHKTGSSYLQTLFAMNRDLLKSNGIFYPHSNFDKQMLTAKVSPGNGLELTIALREKNILKVEKLFSEWLNKCRAYNCNKLLLSNEGLFHNFREPSVFQILESTVKKYGITDTLGLIYFRDFFDHALSLYKHRSKNGRIIEFKKWLEKDYETLELIKKFLLHYDNFGIKWTLRKYKPNSEHLVKSAFEDWLGVKTPILGREIKKVNESMTISEILLLKECQKIIPKEHLIFISEALMELPKDKKAKDDFLEKHFYLLSIDYFTKYKNIINNLNKLLPENEKLESNKEKIVYNENNNNNEILLLSREQIEIVFRIINEFKYKIVSKEKIHIMFKKLVTLYIIWKKKVLYKFLE